MIGGTVIENKPHRNSETRVKSRRLWCVDKRNGDELAVYADLDEAWPVRVGDEIWWQGKTIYWSREGQFTDRKIRKIGFSFDPRNSSK